MRFQGKPGSLQLSLRFRDTRLLGSTTTTNNLMVESKYRINPQKGDSKSTSKQGQQERCRRGKELLTRSTQHPKHPCQHFPHPRSLHLNTPTASLSSHRAKTRCSSPEGEQDAGTTKREEERQNRREGTSKGRHDKIRDKNLGRGRPRQEQNLHQMREDRDKEEGEETSWWVKQTEHTAGGN